MRKAGRVVAEVLEALSAAAEPGVTTADLDRLAETKIKAAGGVPSFRGVPSANPGVAPFPAVACISVNDEIVHGIPGPRKLKDGDIVSIDVGVIIDGWHGDAAVTVGVGSISGEAERLIETTRTALLAGIEKARPGGWLGDVSAAIQQCAEENGYSVVRDYTGHGIGREMWEGFQVPNFGKPHTGLRLRAGLTMALEPMLNCGGPETRVGRDGWVVMTADGSLSAHFEHTIAVTEDGPVILTEL